MRRESIRPFQLALCLLVAGFILSSCASGAAPGGCVPAGIWIDPESGERRDDMIAHLAGHGVVLLGETHDRADHHRWQLHTVAALHASRHDMVLGFEMFPRRVQPVLDRWVAGGMSEADFLREVDWEKVWSFDAALYLPLFHFARMHRVPMLALNVDRALVRRVGAEGMAAVPVAERQGVGTPAPASSSYRERLFEAFMQHAPDGETAGRSSARFRFFVEAQLFWDRAMAEAIAGTRRDGRRPLVVGIMGQGHVQYREGVVHQLEALGIADVATALPWQATRACRKPDADIADAVFGVAPPGDETDAAAPNAPGSPTP